MSNNGEGMVLLPNRAGWGILPIGPGVAGKPGGILEDPVDKKGEGEKDDKGNAAEEQVFYPGIFKKAGRRERHGPGWRQVRERGPYFMMDEISLRTVLVDAMPIWRCTVAPGDGRLYTQRPKIIPSHW